MKTLPILVSLIALTLTACVGQGAVRPTDTPIATLAPTSQTPTLTAITTPDQRLDLVDASLARLTSFHLESVLEIKATKESDAVLLSMQLIGDGVVNGDSQVQFTVDSEITGILTFREREVKGVGYSHGPFSEEWEIVDAADVGDDPLADIIPDGTVFSDVEETLGIAYPLHLPPCLYLPGSERRPEMSRSRPPVSTRRNRNMIPRQGGVQTICLLLP